jgi:uncharacterized protein (TIGR02996 family)
MIEPLEAHLRSYPEDWPSWLVYADWLTDQGDVRGELIVLEHRLRAPDLPSDARQALEQRVAALQAEHQASWRQGLELRQVELEWHHGFLRRAIFQYGDVIALFERLLAHPASHLLSAACFRRLSSRELRRLLASDVTSGGSLPSLQLDQCEIDPAGLEALPRSVLLRAVSDLELSSNRLGDEGVMALLARGLPESLHGLVLWNEALGPDGVTALATAPSLRGLRRLSLGEVQPGLRGARALAASQTLRALTHLELRACRLVAEGAALLASSELLRGLSRLHLGSNVLGDEGAEALALSPHLRALTHLELPLNSITDYGADALALSDGLPSLVSLNLWGNRIGAAGAAALLGSQTLRPTELDLEQNRVGMRRLAVPIAR